MRVAVVQPPLRDFYLTPHRMSALGAAVVAALCRRAGHEAEAFNFPRLGGGAVLPLPPELEYLRPCLVPGETGPTAFFSRFRRFGPDFPAAARAVAELRPDAVLVASFAYAYAEDALAFGREIRRLLPGVPLAAGGAGPSAWPPYYVGEGGGNGGFGFDLVYTGEAETGFGRLLERLEEFPADARAGGRVLAAPEETEGPEIEVLFSETGPLGGRRFYSVSLSRGCPLACRFCSNRFAHGRKFRTAPLASVERSLAEIPPSGGPIHVNFEDDNLLLDWDHFRGVLELLSTRFPGTTFSAENGLDYRLLDPERLEALLAFGFDRFNFSLGVTEAPAARDQDRGLDLDRHRVLVEILAERGIPSVTYFIAGLEGDTPESVAARLRLLAELPTRAGISLFYPVPGLPGFAPPPENLRRLPGLARGSSAFPWTGALSAADLAAAFRLARWINLKKNGAANEAESELLRAAAEAGRIFTLSRERGGPFPVPGPVTEIEKNFFS